jgi:hypothetical protein
MQNEKQPRREHITLKDSFISTDQIPHRRERDHKVNITSGKSQARGIGSKQRGTRSGPKHL